MIKKTVLSLIILLTTPNTTYSFWGFATQETKQKNGLEKALTKLSNINKKITKKQTELNLLLKKIEADPFMQNFFNNATAVKKELHATHVYQEALYLNQSLALLNDLKTYNKAMVKPHLFHAIEALLPEVKNHGYDQFTHVLLQQRIHLLEISDEFLTLNKLCKQMEQIEQTLKTRLSIMQQNIANLPCITEFSKEQTIYLQHPLIKTLDKIFNDLWSLYIEKESQLLHQKDYQVHLYTLQKEVPKRPLLYTFTDELEKIIILKKHYFDMDFTN